MELHRHLFLTGFMGSGKSTAGKKTAALFACDFLDLDLLIEQQVQKSIPEIFKQDGEAAFRLLESEYLDKIIQLEKPSVVSLGGGTVCFHNNLEKVKQNGLVIYIELSAKTLADRVRNSRIDRPLLNPLSEKELLSHIEELLELRKEFYKQAHITLNGLNLRPQDILSAVVDYTSKHIL